MFSYHYTDKDRRKSAATRRRNAQLRRLNEAKNPKPKIEKPAVELTNGILITKEIEKRLTTKAEGEIPDRIFGTRFVVALLISIFGIILTIVTRYGLFLLIPIVAYIVFIYGLVKRRGIEVRTRIDQLAGERKRRLDETEQFYASPEWQLLRKQVIKEKGRICFNCGTYIKKNVDVTVDHILPRSKYPTLAFDKENLQVLCRECNSRKGAKISPK
ncbi:MAG: HNH endonuclease signature motif containing protein [Chloroflexota bacterium]